MLHISLVPDSRTPLRLPLKLYAAVQAFFLRLAESDKQSLKIS